MNFEGEGQFYPSSLGYISECDSAPLRVPSVVVRQAKLQPQRSSHIIVFANEKGGVGKSTLAFHSSVALSHSGAKVLAIDLDGRQKSLSYSHELREVTMRTLKIPLPSAKYITIEKQSGAYLDQEIRRAGHDIDFIVIDLPGADTPLCRYALAIADTIVTPVGSSPYDLGGLGRVSPTTNKLLEVGAFANLVHDILAERASVGLPTADWIVMKNRVRSGERRIEVLVDNVLDQLASKVGFRIGCGLNESISFRDLNAYGLTYLDIPLIPALGRRNHQSEHIIGNVLIQLELPGFDTKQFNDASKRMRKRPVQRTAPVSSKQAEHYNEMLRQHRKI